MRETETITCAKCGGTPARFWKVEINGGQHEISLCAEHESELKTGFESGNSVGFNPAQASGVKKFRAAGTVTTGRGPHWSSTPPTKPGWYWNRTAPNHNAEPVSVVVSLKPNRLWVQWGDAECSPVEEYGGEWFSEPIQEPPA